MTRTNLFCVLTMSLAEVLAPAIEYAQEGYPIDRMLAASIDRGKAKLALRTDSTGSFAVAFFLLNAVVFTLCGLVMKLALSSQSQAERLLQSLRPSTVSAAR